MPVSELQILCPGEPLVLGKLGWLVTLVIKQVPAIGNGGSVPQGSTRRLRNAHGQRHPPKGQWSYGIEPAPPSISHLSRVSLKGPEFPGTWVEQALALKKDRYLLVTPEGAWQAPDNTCYRRLWGPAMGR